jgi:hypothetical protein
VVQHHVGRHAEAALPPRSREREVDLRPRGLVAEKKLVLEKPVKGKLTYHDSSRDRPGESHYSGSIGRKLK